jgi:hypothetical protein
MGHLSFRHRRSHNGLFEKTAENEATASGYSSVEPESEIGAEVGATVAEFGVRGGPEHRVGSGVVSHDSGSEQVHE